MAGFPASLLQWRRVMPGISCLYRRPSGVYAVRLIVPKRLRETIGRTEIHTSTGVSNLGTAKVAALKIQLYWREQSKTHWPPRRHAAKGSARRGRPEPQAEYRGASGSRQCLRRSAVRTDCRVPRSWPLAAGYGWMNLTRSAFAHRRAASGTWGSSVIPSALHQPTKIEQISKSSTKNL